MSLTDDKPTHDDLPRASFTSFEESTAEDWAVIIPQIQHTQSLVADRVIGLMRELETDFGGFPVNRLEHCLLYTSPSPRDKRQSRMPSSA